MKGLPLFATMIVAILDLTTWGWINSISKLSTTSSIEETTTITQE